MLVSFHLCCLSASRRCSRKRLVLESHQKLMLCLVGQLLQMSKQRPCKIVMCNQQRERQTFWRTPEFAIVYFHILKVRKCHKLALYSQLSPRRTPLGPALAVCLREISTLQKVKQREQRKAGTNSKCPFYRGVCLIEVFVKRESTVFIYLFYFHLN